MDEPDRRSTAIQVSLLGLVTFTVYYHSLFHVPRADQLGYLYQTASHGGLLDLITNTYALNRSIPLGDQILFRPLLYALLALLRWAFGLHFLPWQATSLALHLAVVFSLYQYLRLLAGPRSLLPLSGALFHAVLHAGMELVIWQHIVGYLLCCLGLVRAMLALQRLLCAQEGRASPLSLSLSLWLWTAVAAFTYELGNVAAVLFALALLLASRRPGAQRAPTTLRRAAVVLLLIPAAYGAWSLLDYAFRFHALPGLASGAPAPRLSLAAALPLVLLRWTADTLLPAALLMRVVERMHSLGLVLLHHPGEVVPVWLNIGLALLVLFCAARLAWLRWRAREIDPLPALVLLLLLLSYTLIILTGRGMARGLSEVLLVSPYYIYTFALLLLMAIMNLIARPDTQATLSRAVALGLFGISLISASRTWEMNARIRRVHALPRQELVSAVLALRRAHGAEPGFSIRVAADCAGNHALPWFTPYGRGERQEYRYLSALFPTLIVDKDRDNDAAYLISCPRNEIIITGQTKPSQ